MRAMNSLENTLTHSERPTTLASCTELLNQSLVGILQFDLNAEIHYANQAFVTLFGYKDVNALTKIGLKKLFPKPLDIMRHLRPVIHHQAPIDNVKIQGQTKDGDVITLLVNASFEHTIFTASFLDVTEIESIQKELSLFTQAVEQLGDPLAIADKNGNSVYINKAFENVTGYQAKDILGQKHNILKSGQHDENFYQTLWNKVLKGEVFNHTFVNKRKDGSEYYEEKTITPLHNGQGEITHFVSTGKDITYRVEMEQRLQELAFHDTLTGLINRRAFESAAIRALEGLKRYQRRFALLMIDIDDFKNVNDTLGHEEGDSVLVRIAKLLLGSTRKLDLVARWGGEEFLVLLQEVNQDQALHLAEKIRHKIAQARFGKGQTLTVSIGSTLAGCEDTLDDLNLKADKALYEAKLNGKNQVRLFSPLAETP
jgi:diguanylate cyclase (GGDEF)-like protein/PAS domain S-box-containing protein